jgi:tellurite resistance protein TerC
MNSLWISGILFPLLDYKVLYSSISIFIVLLMLVDLFVLPKLSNSHLYKKVLALLIWIILGFSISILLYYFSTSVLQLKYPVTMANSTGKHLTESYISAYLIEICLSFDNIFVIYAQIQSFQLTDQQETKIFLPVLVSSIVLRMILYQFADIILQYHVISVLAGIALCLVGLYGFIKQWIQDISVSAMTQKGMPVTIKASKKTGFLNKFYSSKHKLAATFCILVGVNIIFAVDSIPVVLAISHEPLVIFLSLAVSSLGLYSFYLVAEAVFAFLDAMHYTLGIILVFIGAKMAYLDAAPISWLHKNADIPMPNWLTLVVVMIAFGLGTLISKMLNNIVKQKQKFKI